MCGTVIGTALEERSYSFWRLENYAEEHENRDENREFRSFHMHHGMSHDGSCGSNFPNLSAPAPGFISRADNVPVRGRCFSNWKVHVVFFFSETVFTGVLSWGKRTFC
ncbi:unnamed protein product [Durusdinium trenchii]|uniref:Uncharacterized protein n=1 Tax=Durusdinium trenchii TaxID=1381693 RepID=A0ABP0KL55_9DINO